MKHRYIFNHDHYYHTLKGQIGEGVPVFHGVKQRGGGLGSVLGSIAKYAFPLIQRYILPHAKSAALSTLADISTGGHTVKQALRKNGVGFLKNVGGQLLNSTDNQTGHGLTRQTNKRKSKSYSVKKRIVKKKSKQTRKGKKRQKKSKTSFTRKPLKKNKSPRSRLDVFS